MSNKFDDARLKTLVEVAKYQNGAIDCLMKGDLSGAHASMRGGSSILLTAARDQLFSIEDAIGMYVNHIFRAGYFMEMKKGSNKYVNPFTILRDTCW